MSSSQSRHIADTARAAYARGDHKEADRLSREALALDPDRWEALMILGLLSAQDKAWTDACNRFERAVELAPNHPSPLFHLAGAQRALGELDEAEKNLRRALAIEPRFLDCHLALAQLGLIRRDPILVAEHLNRAMQINGADPGLGAMLTQAVSTSNQIEGVEQALLERIRYDPQNSVAKLLLGWFLQESGRWEEARHVLAEAVSLEPRLGLAFWGLVREKKIKEDDEHLVARIESLSKDPRIGENQRSFLFFALGKAFDDLGRFDSAMQAYDEANRLALRTRRPFDREQYRALIDRTIEIFSPSFVERHRSIGSKDETPILVVGMVRSGTTLTEQIVSSHPDVGPGGEQRFWPENMHRAFDQEIQEFDPSGVRVLQQEYLSLLHSLSPGSPRVTDKMPLNVELMGLIHLMFPRAKILHVRRNPVANCLSIYTTAFAAPPDFAYSRDDIAFAYSEYRRLVRYWHEVLPEGSFFEFDYEALVENPEPVIRQIIGYCGLPWDEACLRHDSNKRVVATPSSWQVRQPVYRTSMERWHHYEAWLGPFLELNNATN